MFKPKFDKKKLREACKKSISNISMKWLIFSGTQATWKKLKQLLGKTQENIQKLKQNEHQVLSCTQKKCKINTPALHYYLKFHGIQKEQIQKCT